MNKKKIIAIIPAYNTERTLQRTIQAIDRNVVDEIIVVNDGSSDTTSSIAQKEQVILFEHSKNKGYGAAQKTAYAAALKEGADIIAMVHSDFQYDPTLLPGMVQPLKDGIADACFGSRLANKKNARKGGMPLWRFLANIILTKFEDLILGLGLSEYHTGYRVYSRETLSRIPFEKNSDNYVFDTQMIAQLRSGRFRVHEIPIPTRYSSDSASPSFLKSLEYGFATVWVMMEYLMHITGLKFIPRLEVKKAEQITGLPKNPKTVFVTGAAGFIGSHICEKLLSMDCKVHALVKSGADLSNINHLQGSLILHETDLNDQVELKKLLSSIAPSGIIHMAASNISSGRRDSDDVVLKTNVMGTKCLLEAAADLDYDFFLNTGSFLEYGVKDHAIKEDEVCEAPELYSISKLSASLLAQSVGRKFGKPIVTFRLFTPYGPRVQEGRFVYEVCSRALSEQAINLTEPSVARDFIFVEDIVDLYIEAMDKARLHPGAIFNAGTGKAVTLGSLVDLVLSKTASKSSVKWGAFPKVAYDSDLWEADMNKTFSAFSWRPKHSLEQGLDKTITWLKASKANKMST